MLHALVTINWPQSLETWQVKGREAIIEDYYIDENNTLQLRVIPQLPDSHSKPGYMNQRYDFQKLVVRLELVGSTLNYMRFLRLMLFYDFP